MKRALRYLWKGTKWLLLVVVGVSSGLIAINAFDQKLSPEATTLTQRPDNPYRPEQNLYIAMVGFDAPSGASVTQVAQARIAESERAAEEWIASPSDESEDTGKEEPTLKFIGKVDFCKPFASACVRDVVNHRAEVEQLVSSNRELLARYVALHQLVGYYETENPSAFSRLVFVPSNVRNLFLATVALDASSHTDSTAPRAAIAALTDDIATWRRMLLAQNSMVSKAIAAAYLQGDYSVLADIVARPEFDATARASEIEAALDLVKLDDWKFRGVFEAEFRNTTGLIDQSGKGWNERLLKTRAANKGDKWLEFATAWVEGYFFQPGATKNLEASHMLRLQQMADAKPPDFPEAMASYRLWVDDNLGIGPRWIYNPTGRFMMGIVGYSYDNYPRRAYDVAAYQQGVRLAYEIRKARITGQDVLRFMRDHPELSLHPVGGAPFVWRPETHDLLVAAIAQNPAWRRFDVPVWNPSPSQPD